MVTFDLGRVTTLSSKHLYAHSYCGDVRSRTSYNLDSLMLFELL